MNLPVVRSEPPEPAAATWVPRPPDPDLDNPRLAASQFSHLLATVEADRAHRDAKLSASHEHGAEAARRHRDTAVAIRDRVDEVWQSLSEPLAQFGITELDDIRVEPAAPAAAPGRAGRTSVTMTKPVAAGPRGRAELTATAKRAHDHCMVAMSRSAELRAELKPDANASVALVTGMGVLAAAGVAVPLRLFTDFAGLPCIAVGIALAACLVGAAAGGARAVVRGGLLGGALAALVVLATAKVAPTDPGAVIGSVVVILLAARFAVGIGAHRDQPSAPPASARDRRRR
jgi:hypothetical protein